MCTKKGKKKIREPDKEDNEHAVKKKDDASNPIIQFIWNEVAPAERKAGLRCPGGCDQ